MKSSLLTSLTKNWFATAVGALTVVALLASLGVSFFAQTEPVHAATVNLITNGDFGTGSDDADIDDWEEKGNEGDTDSTIAKNPGTGDDSVSPDGGRFAKIGRFNPSQGQGGDGFICQKIDATGVENLTLEYYWRGDTDAESPSQSNTDYGYVEYRTNGSCESAVQGWTNLATHVLDEDTSDPADDTSWSSLQSINLSALDGENKIFIRFRAKVTSGTEHFRVDGVKVSGDEIKTTIQIVKLIDADGNLATTDDQTPAAGWDFYIDESGPYTTGEGGMTEVVNVEDDEEYDIEEDLKEGYELLSASCVGADDNGSRDGNSVEDVEVEEGDEVVCTFINAPLGEDFTDLVTVTGDTSAGENLVGWLFNRDTSTATPFEFNDEEASIGTGSLNILPIGSNPSDKFIGEYFLLKPVADVLSIMYDFQIGSGGDTSDANHFYMNVYANFGESSPTNFYDCRYNIVPLVGSTAGFTTVSFDPTQSYSVTTRGSSPYTCPSIPTDMDTLSPGSTIRVIALNVGDTAAGDVGLDGYLDNVVIALADGVDTYTTTYDFEPEEGGQGGDGDQCVETTMVVSDELTLDDEGPATLLTSSIHTAWTALISGASWIWSAEPMPEGYINDVTKVFTREFTVVGEPLGGELEIAADNSYEVTLNGDPLCSDSLENNFASTDTCVIAAEDLVQGTNTLVFTVKNWAQGGGTINSNPAGLLYKLSVDEDVCTDPEPETPWCSFAGTVVDYTPDVDAKTNGGAAVNPARRNISAVETIAPYQNVGGSEGSAWNVSPLDFFSLGIEGFLTYEFTGAVAFDQAGDDIAIYEITGGTANTDEKVRVLVSQNGVDFVEVETISGDGAIDISGTGLDYVKFVKLIDDSAGIQGTNGDGYDVDAIVILTGSCGDEPKLAQCEVGVELLQNGGFENPTVTHGSNWNIFASGFSGLEWVVAWLTGDTNAPAIANIELQKTGLNGWTASEGNQWTELDADWNGHAAGPNGEEGAVAISQTIGTEVGATYTLSFDFSARPGTASANNKVEVLVNNVVKYTAGPVATAGNQTEWGTHTFAFVADATQSVVTFRDAGTPNNSLGTFIDNTSLVCSGEPYEAAPYCGDGIQNQAWEQCDGGDQCTQQCQVVTDQCTEDIFARVVVDTVANTGTGNATSDVFLGQGASSIPSGTWFPVVLAGTPVLDAAISGYEDVAGVAVERGTNGITVLLHGSATGVDKEHVQGYLEFFNSTATSQTSLTGQNKVEKPTDGTKKIKPGQDEIWLDSGVSHFWLTTTTADDGFTTGYAKALSCNPFATVTMCKFDEQNNPLSGWALTLLGSQVDSFAVPSNDLNGVDSVSLGTTTSYVALASGTWTNQGGANPVDAEYSTTDNWATHMDGYTGYGVGILELELGLSDGSWGPYNSLHQYAQMFVLSVDGPVNFRVFDGDTGTHTVNPGWYGDNGGSLQVEIYEGYAGVTGENGCVVFNDVPFGEYVAGELAQEGWTQIDGPTNPVNIDTETVEFSFANTQEEIVVEETATLSATKIVCEAEEYLPNWGNGTSGPGSIDANTAIDWLAEGDNSDYCWLAPDWDFQWVTNTDSSSNPGDNLLVPAASPWTTFGVTDANGVVSTIIPAGDTVWVREILQDGYVPFSGQNTHLHESAELYCGADVLNYDNWDFISSVAADETYYCVAFNAVDVPTCTEGEHLEEGQCVPDEQNTAYADLSLKKEVSDDTPTVGQQITYTITLKNDGPDATGNIEVLDVLPSGVTYVSHVAGSGTYATTTGVWTVLSLGDDISTMLTITVIVNSGEEGQIITNVAEIKETDSTDVNYDNDADSAEILVEEEEEEEENGGGGGGDPTPNQTLGGGVTSLGGGVLGGGVVLGASTEQCAPLLSQYMRIGFNNDPNEVTLLQQFLNRHMDSGLAVTGLFGAPTEEAVKRFQWRYRFEILQPWGISQPTGIVYLTTLRWINMLDCQDLNLPLPPLVEWSSN